MNYKINVFDIMATKAARKIFFKGFGIGAILFLILGFLLGSLRIWSPSIQSKLNQEARPHVSYYESVLLDLNRYKDLIQELEALEPGISPKMIVRWRIIHLENALIKKIKLCSAKEQSFLMRYFQHFHARKQAAWE